MTRLQKIATVSEIIASIAVIVSLIYVGVQVNLNTHAIQGSTNQSLYALNQEFKLVAGADYADLKVRFARDPGSITAADSLRWNGYLNIRINIYESVLSNRESGTIEEQMARSWLNGLKNWVCEPGAAEWWTSAKDEYVPLMVEEVEAAFAATSCTP